METFNDRLGRRLREASLFAGLPPGRLAPLVETAAQRRGPAGTVLWAEGSTPDAMVVVLEGTLDLVRREGARRLLLRTLHPGDILGTSAIAGVPNSADLVAGPDLEIAVLRGAEVRGLLRREPEVALRFIAHLGQLVARISAEREEALRDGLDRRLWRWIEGEAAARRSPDIPCTHEQIADHIGASRPRVSEALKRLEKAGRIQCLRGLVRCARGGDPVSLP